MDYRVDEVGALIFKPRDDENKANLGEILEEINRLKDRVSKLEKENQALKKEIKEIGKGIAE